MLPPLPAPGRATGRIVSRSLALAVLLLAAGAGFANRRATSDDAPEAHRRMVALLATIARDTPLDYPSRTALQELEERRAALPPDAPPREVVPLLGAAAEHHFRRGELERARALYEESLLLAERPADAGLEALVPILRLNLGLVRLRLAENRNCIHTRSGESCILPLRGGGIHPHPQEARAATREFVQVLEGSPPDTAVHLTARWLLNLATMATGDYPDGVPDRWRIDPALFKGPPFPHFPNIAPALGIDIENLAGGVVVEDLDGDGDLDLFTTRLDPGGQDRLFRNDGAHRFTAWTDQAGLRGITGGLNAVQADYDNDGWVDLLILRGAWNGRIGREPNSLLRNLGGLSFADVSFDVGLGAHQLPTQVGAWADYDGDGDLDLFIGNESNAEMEAPSQLFRGEGGRFENVAAVAGVENRRWTKGAAWGDVDGDGRPDLYLSNLHGDNRLYRNVGDGTFRDIAPEVGVTGPRSSFSVWFWDWNQDGNLDLLVNAYLVQHKEPGVPHVSYAVASLLGMPHLGEHPALYEGDGEGGFTNVAGDAGLGRVTLPMGANFGDLDGDGYPDFYLGTGYPGYEGLLPNVMYHNLAGRRFEDVTFSGGFGHLQKGHGIAFADIDDDGDQDVFAQMGGMFLSDASRNALFENPGFGASWVSIRLVGTRSNRSAIGARVRLRVEGPGGRRTLHRWVGSGGSFGANPLRQEIGLGDARRIAVLEVLWPGPAGWRQVYRDLAVNQRLEIRESPGGAAEGRRPAPGR